MVLYGLAGLQKGPLSFNTWPLSIWSWQLDIAVAVENLSFLCACVP